MLRRVRRVAAGCPGREPVLQRTLFRHSHQHGAAGNLPPEVFAHRAALVEHGFQTDAVRFEPFGGARRSGAANLFVTREIEVHGAPWAPVSLEKGVQRGEQGALRAFHVERTAAPDLPVHNFAGKRRVLPALRRGGDDVHVAAEEHGLFLCLRAFELQQQRFAHGDLLRLPEQVREQLPQGLPVARDLIRSARHGWDGNHPAQLFFQSHIVSWHGCAPFTVLPHGAALSRAALSPSCRRRRCPPQSISAPRSTARAAAAWR